MTIPSFGVVLDGDHLCRPTSESHPDHRSGPQGRTYLDLRSVDRADDEILAEALTALGR